MCRIRLEHPISFGPSLAKRKPRLQNAPGVSVLVEHGHAYFLLKIVLSCEQLQSNAQRLRDILSDLDRQKAELQQKLALEQSARPETVGYVARLQLVPTW